MDATADFRDGKLLRIFVDEKDRAGAQPLYTAIVEFLRKNGVAGATVFRGIMGFGATSKIHTDRFAELSADLPIVVECIDTQEKLDAILPELDAMLGGGLITLEKVRVIMYRAG